MIRNVHERSYPVDPERLGELLDRVAGSDSPLWPADRWPAMILDRPLGVGAAGGHGPIRYRCTAYRPGRLVEFTFAPGFWARGTHILEVLDPATLRHTMTFRPRGAGHLLWPLAFRWLPVTFRPPDGGPPPPRPAWKTCSTAPATPSATRRPSAPGGRPGCGCSAGWRPAAGAALSR